MCKVFDTSDCDPRSLPGVSLSLARNIRLAPCPLVPIEENCPCLHLGDQQRDAPRTLLDKRMTTTSAHPQLPMHELWNANMIDACANGLIGFFVQKIRDLGAHDSQVQARCVARQATPPQPSTSARSTSCHWQDAKRTTDPGPSPPTPRPAALASCAPVWYGPGSHTTERFSLLPHVRWKCDGTRCRALGRRYARGRSPSQATLQVFKMLGWLSASCLPNPGAQSKSASRVLCRCRAADGTPRFPPSISAWPESRGRR